MSAVGLPRLPRLVILGTGWGSFSVFRNVKKPFYRVIVISPRNHFLFTPLLCSTTVGTLEFRSIIDPIRNYGFREAHDYHLSEAISWSPDSCEIHCRSCLQPENTYSVPYDRLVIGVGALSNTFGVPGVPEYACFLKEVSDARQIRLRILNNCEMSMTPGVTDEERKRLLHTVIVGGGPTGVEFGAELYDFIKQDVARLYGQSTEDVSVTLIEANKILASFDSRLQNYAEKKIRARRNFSLLQTSVTEVKRDSVILKDGRELPCGLVVWSTGLAPRPFVKDLPVDKSPQGQILVDSHLRIISDTSGRSYALGDCSHCNELPLPCTAQVAERQGRYLGRYINAIANDKEARVAPFTFKSMGMLAYVGDYRAVSDTPEFKLKGVTSWFLWRSAYLTRLGSWRLRMQVPLDWLKTLIFGRDTSRF